MRKKVTQNNDYRYWFGEIKSRIQNSQQKAALKVNQELLSLYWYIGKMLDQTESEWGDKYIDNLSRDLKLEFPEMRGFSKSNLKSMKRWYLFHNQNLIIGQQAVDQLDFKNDLNLSIKIGQQAVDQIQNQLLFNIPWGHNLLILSKIKVPEEVYFYIIKTIQNGWSRNVLNQQIENDLYERQGKSLTNFELTLPNHQADLAKETLKNPYNFDFLTLAEDVKELDLERGLISHIKNFLLELGKGFAYVGNQYNLNVAGTDFFLDLLFFNTNLNCYVVFELKVGDFKPEFAGKLNMYVNTVNEKIKRDFHGDTIGVLLCKTPNKTVIEYSIKGISTPVGVSNYKLKKTLPRDLKKTMPTVKELTEELALEIEPIKDELTEKRQKLMAILESKVKEEVQVTKNAKNVKLVVDKVFRSLISVIKSHLEKLAVSDLYLSKEEHFTLELDPSSKIDEFIHKLKTHSTPEYINYTIKFNGFKKAGVKAFSNQLNFRIYFNKYKYEIDSQNDKFDRQAFLYSHILTSSEINELAQQIVNNLMDNIIRDSEKI